MKPRFLILPIGRASCALGCHGKGNSEIEQYGLRQTHTTPPFSFILMAICTCGFQYTAKADYRAHLLNGRHNSMLELPDHLTQVSIFDNPDFGHRNCAVCGEKFTSIQKYRDHHYKGRCGGY